jgi:hypothetical protein
MNILKKVSIILGSICVILIIVGLLLPSQQHLETSITINASPRAVFEEVNSFKKWENWSPWSNIDPNATMSYEGPETGVGCAMYWSSEDPKVGKGSQKIVVSEPYQKIVTQIFVGDCNTNMLASWKFEEQEGGSTKVTWMNDNNSNGKLVNKYLIWYIAYMLEKDYQKGLQALKEYVERIYTAEGAIQKEAEILAQ